ncbi:hypothetical protein [Urbifossiella limnaea]|uniref:Uncharacterized protein n=1 Tax=Urbifossiella limnaea TaxID=2528023 RepID=A0A517XZA6_9BACT|nr:hypothetical protein [Urbifossiella limnaea]QDU22813.1 hypothetical protein ETAA1_48010 [Urbifossiella limnaea]
MTRLLLLTVFAASAVGCTGLPTSGSVAKSDAPPEKDAVAAGRPVPPAILITPGEVAADNPAAALTKLGNELDYDLKNTPPAPKTPIVTRYKNGEKVE